MEIQIFHHAKIQSSQNPPKEPKSTKISNSITNLKFPTQAKTSVFKNSHIKVDLLPRD